MRKLLQFAVVSGSLTALLGLGVAAPAGATPPTGYGFDNTAHIIVGGGSDTTYNAMNAITKLWDASLGCPTNTGAAASPAPNTCVTNASPETNTLGNYQHDTVVQAFPTGSSTGLASLNGEPSGITYSGTVNNGTNVDFARSSREPIVASPFPKSTCLSGGSTGTAENELECDTFWGFAEDGVEVMGFNSTAAGAVSRGSEFASDATGLTDAELFDIWDCQDTSWYQVASLGITQGSAQDGPIVAWGMNSGSGTFGTFNSYLTNKGGAPSGFSVDAQACDHQLTAAGGGIFPFENDIKPILNDVQNNGMLAAAPDPSAPAGITGGATDVTNPANWIWFGSGGVLNSYPYTSSYAIGGNTYTAVAADVDGISYSTAHVTSLAYPIDRTLYHVTRKTDADCPSDAGQPAFNKVCDFTGNPGPSFGAHNGQAAGTDLNVLGGSSGISGAVREFTRFLCRPSTDQYPNDTLTGTNLFTEIQGAVKADGFVTIPTSLKTAGTSCHVES